MNTFQVVWELFPDEILKKLLEGIKVKTDNDRLMEVKFHTILLQHLGKWFWLRNSPCSKPVSVKNGYRLLTLTVLSL